MRSGALYIKATEATVKNCTFRDNDFCYSFDHEYGERVALNAAVSIENARDVEISGNRCPDGVSVSDWITAENSADVFGDDVIYADGNKVFHD